MWEPSERKFVQQAASTINITWSHGLPSGIPTPGIPIPKIIGIPVVGIKGYRPGIPTKVSVKQIYPRLFVTAYSIK